MRWKQDGCGDSNIVLGPDYTMVLSFSMVAEPDDAIVEL